MSPTLFNMMFSVMLTDAVQDCDAGFPFMCRFDGKLFKCDVVTSFFKTRTIALGRCRIETSRKLNCDY